MRRVLTVVAVASIISFGSTANSASIFFGEDLNPGGTVPAAGNAKAAQTNFLSGLVGVGIEDFESFPNQAANGTTLTFVGNAIQAQFIDGGGGQITDSPCCGRFATSGTKLVGNVTNGFTLDFTGSVAAFGFYGTDIGDFNGQITLELTNGLVQNYTVPNTVNGPNGSLLFWGIIAGAGETFNKAVFGNTAAGSDFFGFDDLIIGDLQQVKPIPVPAALPLLLSALGGLGFLARRRRQSA